MFSHMDPLNDIITKLRKADLNQEEEWFTSSRKEDFDDRKKTFTNSCYGKLLAEKEFNILV